MCLCVSVLDCNVNGYVSEDVQKFVLLCVCNGVKMHTHQECVSVCECMIVFL